MRDLGLSLLPRVAALEHLLQTPAIAGSAAGAHSAIVREVRADLSPLNALLRRALTAPHTTSSVQVMQAAAGFDAGLRQARLPQCAIAA